MCGIIRNGGTDEELKDAIRAALEEKPEGHAFWKKPRRTIQRSSVCHRLAVENKSFVYGGKEMKRAAIITSSDTGYCGEREDLSGPAIREILQREGYQVVSMDILPDDRRMLSEKMAEIADNNRAELILTTGGTGFSQRDVTPEATEDIIQRRVPGIPEAMRACSMTITKRAMLSRATAGIRKKP